MIECTVILFLAFILDYCIGDPEYSYHPVRLIGHIITGLEKFLRRINLSGIAGGLLLLLFTIMIALFVWFVLNKMFSIIHYGLAFAFNVFVVYSSIGFRNLLDYAYTAADALKNDDLILARQTAQNIVGRDVNQLDASGVARAAIESVAENFVDGLLAPVFWYATACMIAARCNFHPVETAVLSIWVYRVVNTLDSMVGYRNEKYKRFGRFSALFDDALNFIPARLSIFLITIASFLSRMNTVRCWQIGWRDRLKHPSPNAGHAESCLAGALGLRLGGPAYYSRVKDEKPWIGDGTVKASFMDIRKSCRLIRLAGLSTIFGLGVLILI